MKKHILASALILLLSVTGLPAHAQTLRGNNTAANGTHLKQTVSADDFSFVVRLGESVGFHSTGWYEGYETLQTSLLTKFHLGAFTVAGGIDIPNRRDMDWFDMNLRLGYAIDISACTLDAYGVIQRGFRYEDGEHTMAGAGFSATLNITQLFGLYLDMRFMSPFFQGSYGYYPRRSAGALSLGISVGF